MRTIRIIPLLCYFCFPLYVFGVNKPSTPDSSLQAVYAELKNKTEALFEAKKDSFSYESDNSSIDKTRNIYSIVQIGNLFSKYDKHALIAYSLNDTALFVEIRQLIGKVWVRRFRNISSTSRLAHPFPRPISLRDFNGDGIPELYIVTLAGYVEAVFLERGDGWILTRDVFQKIKGFELISNPEYDSKTKQILGCFISCMGGDLWFESYEMKKNYELEKVKEISCECCNNGEAKCKVTIDKKNPIEVHSEEIYKYVPPFYVEKIKIKFGGPH
jgi:hypothetical protein